MPLANRIYAGIVRLLPAAFRTRYGDELITSFGDDLARARRRGRARAIAIGLAAVFSVLCAVPREHWRAAGNHSVEESMRSFWFDLRAASRSVVRQRGASLLIVVTLTVAVACNSAVFTLLDGVFLRPFPFPQPDRLVYLNERAPRWNLDFTGINFPDFSVWRRGTRTFASMSVFGETRFNVDMSGAAERIDGAMVSWDLARTLGISPVLGRTFREDEDHPGGPRVVMIGYRFWRSRFLGSRDVIGQTLRIDSRPYTVIGVLPPAGEFPGGMQLWIPIDADPSQPWQDYEWDGVGRLRPGVTLAAARADLLRAHQAVWQKSDSAHVVSPTIMPLRQRFDSDYAAVGRVLALSVGLVLLIACANVAAAMLTRAATRRRELAVRVALGASGGRIARQVLTESLVLAAVATLCGTLVGWWAIRALALASGDLLPAWVHLGLDWRIAAFSGLLMSAVALLFGMAPALEARRQGLDGVTGIGDRSGSVSRRQRRTLDTLVVVEIAVAVVLLVGGGLLLRAFRALEAEDPGFRVDGTLTFSLSLPDATYRDGVAERQLYERVVAGLQALPGVTSAGAVTCPPFTCHWGNFYRAEGSALAPGGDNPVVLTRVASPDYFRAMGIRFVQGRAWTAAEQVPLGGAFPVIVNEEFARLHWPGVADVVGRRIAATSDGSPWMTIVGVVHDVRHYGLTEPMRPGIYMAMSFLDKGHNLQSFSFVAHTAGDPVALFPEVQALVRGIDPELPIIRLRTLRQSLDASLLQRRSMMLVLGVFAVMALGLAIGGLYAVLSHVVGRRRREIGIRMALGARRGQVIAMVIRRGAWLIAAGLAIGFPVALLGSRVLASMLVGVTGSDPATYAVVAVLLTMTGLAATLAPARRAASADPNQVLNEG